MEFLKRLIDWYRKAQPLKHETIDRAGAADLLDSFAERSYCSGEYEWFDIYLRDNFSDPLLAQVSQKFRRIQDEFEATGGTVISSENLESLRKMSALLRSSESST